MSSPQQSYSQPLAFEALPAEHYRPRNNGVGVAGFVLGLLGLIFCWVPGFGLVLGILGVVLGSVGLDLGRRAGTGSAVAIAGLVCGIVSFVPAVLVIVAVVST